MEVVIVNKPVESLSDLNGARSQPASDGAILELHEADRAWNLASTEPVATVVPEPDGSIEGSAGQSPVVELNDGGDLPRVANKRLYADPESTVPELDGLVVGTRRESPILEFDDTRYVSRMASQGIEADPPLAIPQLDGHVERTRC